MADLRKLRTQREIQQALADLLLKKTFSKITVTDIVNKALINRNTFYLHYRDKYDLVEQIMMTMVDQSSFSINEFNTIPFYFLRSISNETSDLGHQVINRQRADSEFQEVVLKTILKLVMTDADSSNSQIWFTFGKISAIMAWNNQHGYYYDIIQDADQLQQIFDTEEFPNLTE